MFALSDSALGGQHLSAPIGFVKCLCYDSAFKYCSKRRFFMDIKLQFSELNQVLCAYPQLESVSFVQGMLVGQVCGVKGLSEAQWIKTLVDEGEMGAISQGVLMALHQLYLPTLAGLNSAECDFELLLPDDDAPLAYRAKHLADWCEGFLFGMGLAGEAVLSNDVQELLRDFSQISMLEMSDDEADEAEDDLMELIEFVRMGALMIHEECNPLAASPIDLHTAVKPTLH